MNESRSGVIGTGYVGLVTAAGFAELGSDVWCVDIDAAKVERLKRGEVPIYEPGPGGAAGAQRRAAALLDGPRAGRWSTRGCCSSRSARRRPTRAMPTSRRCTRWSTRCRRPTAHALVMKSTVPVGTGRRSSASSASTARSAFSYVSCPEFLKEGSAVKDFLHPDRVVSATTATGRARPWRAVRAARCAAACAPTSPAPR